MKYDIKVKTAKFIHKSKDLLQEYPIGQTRTKHFTRTLHEAHMASMLEYSWNKNIIIMFQLHLETLRYLICPISGRRHLWFILLKRFISFAKKCEVSSKKRVQHLSKIVQKDVQFISGYNIRKTKISQDIPADTLGMEYHNVENETNGRDKT